MAEPNSNELLAKVAQYIAQQKSYAGSPSITADDKVVKEFQKAVRDGKVAEFFVKHPDLTRDDFYALYRLVNEEERAPAFDLGFDPNGPGVDPTMPDPGNPPVERINRAGSDFEGARGAVQQAADRSGFFINPGQQSPYEFASKYIEQYIGNNPALKQALDAIEDPAQKQAALAQTLNGFLAKIVSFNPQLQQMDVIPEGYAIDMGFLPAKYVWQKGDTLDTVAAERGMSADELRQWLQSQGVDPDTLLPGTPVTMPGRASSTATPTATGGRGEQTQPETNFPDDTTNPTTDTPGGDGGSGGGGGGDYSTNSDTELVNRILDYGGSQALIADILGGKGIDPSERARLISKGPQLDALNQLMLATGAFDITGQENARDNFASLLGSPPSSAAIRDQLLGLGTPGAEGSPSDAYLQNPDNPMNALAVLMNQSLGSRAAGTFLTPATVATIQAQLANQQQSDPSASIIPLLHSLGWI